MFRSTEPDAVDMPVSRGFNWRADFDSSVTEKQTDTNPQNTTGKVRSLLSALGCLVLGVGILWFEFRVAKTINLSILAVGAILTIVGPLWAVGVLFTGAPSVE